MAFLSHCMVRCCRLGCGTLSAAAAQGVPTLLLTDGFDISLQLQQAVVISSEFMTKHCLVGADAVSRWTWST